MANPEHDDLGSIASDEAVMLVDDDECCLHNLLCASWKGRSAFGSQSTRNARLEAHPYLGDEAKVCRPCFERVRYTREALRCLCKGETVRHKDKCEGWLFPRLEDTHTARPSIITRASTDDHPPPPPLPESVCIFCMQESVFANAEADAELVMHCGDCSLVGYHQVCLARSGADALPCPQCSEQGLPTDAEGRVRAFHVWSSVRKKVAVASRAAAKTTAAVRGAGAAGGAAGGATDGVAARTRRAKAAEAAKTARTTSWDGTPSAAKRAAPTAATAGPTTTPNCDAAETRLSASAESDGRTRSVTPACATGIDAAKTPPRKRPTRMP